MQVILDSSFARPGSAPIWGGKKGEFRDWTMAASALFYRDVKSGSTGVGMVACSYTYLSWQVARFTKLLDQCDAGTVENL